MGSSTLTAGPVGLVDEKRSANRRSIFFYLVIRVLIKINEFINQPINQMRPNLVLYRAFSQHTYLMMAVITYLNDASEHGCEASECMRACEEVGACV